MTNLLLAIEDWTSAIELGYNIDIIYTDFAKAFDSVPHNRLLVKLESIGIRGEVLQWIKAFLTKRKHRVNVEGEISSWTYPKSGVPQGSVLGPTLFVIFINDMPNVLQNCCKLFADDAKVYDKIKTNGDTSSLQEDIDRLLQWSHTWNLPFNEEKCKSMRIGKTTNTIRYYMNEHELETIEEEKDLGVIIDNKLNFHTHTSAAN